VREEISKKKGEEKRVKWGSIQYKQYRICWLDFDTPLSSTGAGWHAKSAQKQTSAKCLYHTASIIY